jgi:hypothetical protein
MAKLLKASHLASVAGAAISLAAFQPAMAQTTPEPQPFKGGLYHLARKRPDVELVPVWMENLGRLLPKGEIVPVPLLCSISFGTPLRLQPGEDKETFLGRVREALLATMREARPAES